jgi:hypothetical protein
MHFLSCNGPSFDVILGCTSYSYLFVYIISLYVVDHPNALAAVGRVLAQGRKPDMPRFLAKLILTLKTSSNVVYISVMKESFAAHRLSFVRLSSLGASPHTPRGRSKDLMLLVWGFVS